MAGYDGWQIISWTGENNLRVIDTTYILGAASGRGLACYFPDQESWQEFKVALAHMQESFTVEVDLDQE